MEIRPHSDYGYTGILPPAPMPSYARYMVSGILPAVCCVLVGGAVGVGLRTAFGSFVGTMSTGSMLVAVSLCAIFYIAGGWRPQPDIISYAAATAACALSVLPGLTIPLQGVSTAWVVAAAGLVLGFGVVLFNIPRYIKPATQIVLLVMASCSLALGIAEFMPDWSRPLSHAAAGVVIVAAVLQLPLAIAHITSRQPNGNTAKALGIVILLSILAIQGCLLYMGIST